MEEFLTQNAALIVLAVVILLAITSAVRIVPQSEKYVVERFGRLRAVLGPGDIGHAASLPVREGNAPCSARTAASTRSPSCWTPNIPTRSSRHRCGWARRSARSTSRTYRGASTSNGGSSRRWTAGAAEVACTNLLMAVSMSGFTVLDSRGIPHDGRDDMNSIEVDLARSTKPGGLTGGMV